MSKKLDNDNYSLTVKEMSKSDRPRERLIKEGSSVLENHELLAILLRTGNKGESVLDFSYRILKRFKGLEDLFEASAEDLNDIKGLGPAKTSELIACMELTRRYNKEKTKKIRERLRGNSVSGPEMATEHLRTFVRDYSKEQFFVLSFDVRNRFIEVDEISSGTLTASLVHPRETFEAAIRRHAASIIVAHNHPSGDSEPSEDDIKITRRLYEAGKILAIELLDHIIFTIGSHKSLKEKGII